MRTVNPHAAEKLHQQLANLLRDAICRGRIPVGAFLPTENQLCQEHAVSKAVVRQATGMLVVEGLVERRAGRGTRVIAERPPTGVPLVHYLGEPSLEFGAELETRIVKKRSCRAGDGLSDLFADSTILFELCRLFLAGGRPVLVETAHLTEEHCRGIAVLNLRGRGVPDLLEGHFGLRLARVQSSLEVASPAPEERRLLELAASERILLCRHRLLLAGDVPVGHLRQVCPEGRARLTFDLRRAGA